MFSNKNKPITPKILALSAVVSEKIEKKGILNEIFVWHLSVRVFQKTQNYFLNVKQQKLTNQTENQLRKK
jgi:hypothetical protein